MEVSDANRLSELEVEHRKLKRLLGEAELDKAALKEPVERSQKGSNRLFLRQVELRNGKLGSTPIVATPIVGER